MAIMRNRPPTRLTAIVLAIGLSISISISVSGCGGVVILLNNFLPMVEDRTTGPYLQMDEAGSVIISWFTPDPLVGEIELADVTDPDAPVRLLTEDEAVEHHAVRVTDLIAGHQYRYRLVGPAATDTDTHLLAAPKAAGERIVFAVLGDSGTGLPAQYAVTAQIEATDPDYIIHAGDVVYPSGHDGSYGRTVFGPFRRLMDHVPIFLTLGNHDTKTLDGAPYLKNFILPRNGPEAVEPERCYSIDLGDVHLVSVDQTRDDTTMAEIILPWLEADLAASDAPWKFVFFHYPIYSSGMEDMPEPHVDRLAWTRIFDETGVDLCIAGHDHFYERSVPIRDGNQVAPGKGTVYLVSGNGGAGLYRMLPPTPFTAAANDQVYGFTRVIVDGSRIEITHIDRSGNVVDQVSWDKSDGE